MNKLYEIMMALLLDSGIILVLTFSAGIIKNEFFR